MEDVVLKVGEGGELRGLSGPGKNGGDEGLGLIGVSALGFKGILGVSVARPRTASKYLSESLNDPCVESMRKVTNHHAWIRPLLLALWRQWAHRLAAIAITVMPSKEPLKDASTFAVAIPLREIQIAVFCSDKTPALFS